MCMSPPCLIISHPFHFNIHLQVKLGTHFETGRTVAVKILNKAKILEKGMKEHVAHEIEILKTLGTHPNIAPLYEVIDSPTDTYLVLENIGGGELYDYLAEQGRLEEDEARRLFQQLINGIDYCHSKDIVHRDLKLDNLLLDSHGNLKVADFGLSKHALKDNMLRTTCGTNHYIAPEILSRHPYHGPEVDVWSCGVILYALVCGYVPFEDENTPRLFEKIKTGDYETLPDHVSESCQDLLSRILEVDPKKRMTIEEIRHHPWFDQHMDPDHHLGVPDKRARPYLDDISEEGSMLSHETSCTYEPVVDNETIQKSRSEDSHHHRKWLMFPFWH